MSQYDTIINEWVELYEVYSIHFAWRVKPALRDFIRNNFNRFDFYTTSNERFRYCKFYNERFLVPFDMTKKEATAKLSALFTDLTKLRISPHSDQIHTTIHTTIRLRLYREVDYVKLKLFV